MPNRLSLKQLGMTTILLLAILAAPGLPAAAQIIAAPFAPVERVTLTVFAAASLTDAFKDIGQQFEHAHPGVTVVFNLAGSQLLAQQLSQGAPADVFASANLAQMKVAVQAGRVTDFQTFARNRLMVIYPAGNPGQIQGLKDLAKPGLQVVLADKSVPAGQYALDFLDKASATPAYGASFEAGVLSNVVSYEDNVKAVFAKVALGDADAGLVYSTDVLSAEASKVQTLDIPEALNTVAAYPIAAITDSRHADLARGFVRYVLSPEGQAVLGRCGFISP